MRQIEYWYGHFARLRNDEATFDLDYSSAVVEDLRARFEHDACVDVLEADCRQMSFRKKWQRTVLLDKGTLDALVGETDPA